MTMFHLLKIRTSIDIFKSEKCKVTFGLEYTCILYCISFIRDHYFSNTYTTSSHITITAQHARARRALQLRGFSMQKFVFEIALFIY